MCNKYFNHSINNNDTPRNIQCYICNACSILKQINLFEDEKKEMQERKKVISIVEERLLMKSLKIKITANTLEEKQKELISKEIDLECHFNQYKCSNDMFTDKLRSFNLQEKHMEDNRRIVKKENVDLSNHLKQSVEKACFLVSTLNEIRDGQFTCPVSYEIMHDPVICEDGYTYERATITEWFDHNNTSSFTGLVMGQNIVPNRALKEAIESSKNLI